MFVSQLPAAERMTRARSQLLVSAPFYGSLALQHCALVEREDIGTAAVDGTSLIYSPTFVESLPEAHLIGLWVHEIMHLAFLHHTRRGNRDPEMWNEACDYAINPRVIAAGYTLPDRALISAEFDGQTAEQIYATLHKRKRDGQDGSEQGAGQGAGAGKPDPSQGAGKPGGSDPGGCGGVIDAAPDAAGNAEAAAAMEATVRQTIAVATAAGAGTMPGDAESILGELNRPRIDWRATTDRFVDDAASRVVDWNRPNRRFVDADFFLPGSAPDSVACLGVAVDVSGSIDAAAVAALMGEAQGVLDMGRVERVHLVTVSSKVTSAADYGPGDTLPTTFKGSGGTAFAPAWAHFEAQGVAPAAVIYLTDLDPARGTWGAEPAYPVLWAVYGNKRSAPFGEVLAIDPHS